LTFFPLFSLRLSCAFTLDISSAVITITVCRLQWKRNWD
jgi:hypothetical protein